MSAPNSNGELKTLSQAIDGSLVVCRVCLSHQVQELKARAGFPVFDEARELEIQHKYEQHWRGGFVVARAVLNLCRED